MVIAKHDLQPLLHNASETSVAKLQRNILIKPGCRITGFLSTANEYMCEPVAAKEEQNQAKTEMLKRALEMEKGVEHGKGQLKTGNNVSSSQESKQAADRSG